MSCVSPPEIDEIQLLAYHDGEADELVEDHLSKCSHCRSRAERLQQWGVNLRAGLYRADCPPAFVLGQFRLDTLPGEQRSEVAAHIETCPHCQSEISLLVEFLADAAPGGLENSENSIRILIARLKSSDLMDPKHEQLAHASLRGSLDRPLVYVVDDIQISLSQGPDAADPAKMALFGLLTGADAAGWEAYLYRDEGEVASTIVDRHGNFVFSDIASDSYLLTLRNDSSQIHIDPLLIGE